MNYSALPLEEESDRLAKELYPFLAARTPEWVLRAMGWPTWLRDAVPLSDDPTDIALHALCYLYLDDVYTANRMQGLAATITFLRAKTGVFPTEDQLVQIKALLDAKPVDAALVEAWFDSIYP